jgi:hypothetical protein
MDTMEGSFAVFCIPAPVAIDTVKGLKFEALHKRIKIFGWKFPTVAQKNFLDLPNEKQAFVTVILNEVASTNRDPHLLFNQVGLRLDFIPEEIVKGGFRKLLG